MPEWTRPCFSQFEYLNAVQSRVFNCAFETNENLLVCAPTGICAYNAKVAGKQISHCYASYNR